MWFKRGIDDDEFRDMWGDDAPPSVASIGENVEIVKVPPHLDHFIEPGMTGEVKMIHSVDGYNPDKPQYIVWVDGQGQTLTFEEEEIKPLPMNLMPDSDERQVDLQEAEESSTSFWNWVDDEREGRDTYSSKKEANPFIDDEGAMNYRENESENWFESYPSVGDYVEVIGEGNGEIVDTLDVDKYRVVLDGGDSVEVGADDIVPLDFTPNQEEPDFSQQRFMGDDPEEQNWEDPTFQTTDYLDERVNKLLPGDHVRVYAPEEDHLDYGEMRGVIVDGNDPYTVEFGGEEVSMGRREIELLSRPGKTAKVAKEKKKTVSMTPKDLEWMGIDDEDMVNNVLLYYENSTPEDAAVGNGWYDQARKLIADMGEQYGFNEAQSVSVAAILSAQCNWRSNKLFSHAIYRGYSEGIRDPWSFRVHPGPGGKIFASTNQRERIIKACEDTEDPGQYATGPKVSVFYANIMGDHNQVTVDVWAMRICVNDPDARNAEGIPYYNPGIPVRRRMQAAYVEAANRAGDITPREIQAVTWECIRRVNGAQGQSFEEADDDFLVPSLPQNETLEDAPVVEGWFKGASPDIFGNEYPLDIVSNPPDPDSYQKFMLVGNNGYFWKTDDPGLTEPTHSDASRDLEDQGLVNIDDIDSAVMGRNYGDFIDAYVFENEEAAGDLIKQWYPNKRIQLNGEDYGEKSISDPRYSWFKGAIDENEFNQMWGKEDSVSDSDLSQMWGEDVPEFPNTKQEFEAGDTVSVPHDGVVQYGTVLSENDDGTLRVRFHDKGTAPNVDPSTLTWEGTDYDLLEQHQIMDDEDMNRNRRAGLGDWFKMDDLHHPQEYQQGDQVVLSRPSSVFSGGKKVTVESGEVGTVEGYNPMNNTKMDVHFPSVGRTIHVPADAVAPADGGVLAWFKGAIDEYEFADMWGPEPPSTEIGIGDHVTVIDGKYEGGTGTVTQYGGDSTNTVFVHMDNGGTLAFDTNQLLGDMTENNTPHGQEQNEVQDLRDMWNREGKKIASPWFSEGFEDRVDNYMVDSKDDWFSYSGEADVGEGDILRVNIDDPSRGLTSGETVEVTRVVDETSCTVRNGDGEEVLMEQGEYEVTS